jgi:hypothetical protein
MIDLVFYDVHVIFPHRNPYPAQKAIMANTIGAFIKKENAVLESPTGTGKTIALLAASLAYQEKVTQDLQIQKIHKIPVFDQHFNCHPEFSEEMLNALFREDPPNSNFNRRKNKGPEFGILHELILK